MKAHPENTVTHYTTKLPKRVDLSGQWECGVVALQFPHTWYNVRAADAYFYLTCETAESGPFNVDGETAFPQGDIPHGFYNSAYELIQKNQRGADETEHR